MMCFSLKTLLNKLDMDHISLNSTFFMLSRIGLTCGFSFSFFIFSSSSFFNFSYCAHLSSSLDFHCSVNSLTSLSYFSRSPLKLSSFNFFYYKVSLILYIFIALICCSNNNSQPNSLLCLFFISYTSFYCISYP